MPANTCLLLRKKWTNENIDTSIPYKRVCQLTSVFYFWCPIFFRNKWCLLLLHSMLINLSFPWDFIPIQLWVRLDGLRPAARCLYLCNNLADKFHTYPVLYKHGTQPIAAQEHCWDCLHNTFQTWRVDDWPGNDGFGPTVETLTVN